jgi:hypothetical protein
LAVPDKPVADRAEAHNHGQRNASLEKSFDQQGSCHARVSSVRRLCHKYSQYNKPEDAKQGLCCLDMIKSRIDTVIGELNDPNGPSFDDRLTTYREWAREVGRYSFRCHR